MPAVDGPVLEVGSKEYGTTSTFRDFYRGNEYLGVDMAAGPGVDQVVDLTQSSEPLKEGHFALAICCSVLEHVDKPWLFARNLARVVRPGGRLYVSVPWAWRYHAYPDDYFRFSHRGIMSLFDEFEWGALYFSTTVLGEFVEIAVKDGECTDSAMAVLGEVGNDQKRRYLPYLMINMLGTRR